MKAGTLKYEITIPLIRPKIQQMAIQIKRITHTLSWGKFLVSSGNVRCNLLSEAVYLQGRLQDLRHVLRKVGTFCNQTAGYADCDNETAGYVNGNVAEVTAGKKFSLVTPTKITMRKINIIIPLFMSMSATLTFFLSILSSSYH